MSTLTETSGSMMGQTDNAYRVLSSSAVLSLVLGVLSPVSALEWRLAVVPAVGVLVGLLALRSIRRAPEEYTGGRLALGGVVLSLAGWAGGWSWLGYQYFAEVPEGYERISYAALQPDKETPDQLPLSAQQLDGKRVFIKGFMYPSGQTERLEEFVLCRDNGTCCFDGPKPKLTDMILVRCHDPLRLDYAAYARGVAGTFRVRPISLGEDLGTVVYQLEADYAR